jgi:hypothetical protein
MIAERRSFGVIGLLLGAWLLVVAWQAEEHQRVANAAKLDLRNRSHEIANTISAVIRAASFRSTALQDRLQPVLNYLVTHTNALAKSGDRLIAVTLLNTNGDPVLSIPVTNSFARQLPAQSEYWGSDFVTFVMPVEGAPVEEGAPHNATVLLPGPREFTNAPPPRESDFQHHGPHADEFSGTNNPSPTSTNRPPPPNDAGMGMPPPPRHKGKHPPPDGDRGRHDRGRLPERKSVE